MTTKNALTVMQSETIAATRSGPTAVAVGGVEYAVLQQVNVPILKHGSGQTVAVRIELPLRAELTEREIEMIDAAGAKVKGTQSGEITVARVTELSSGQLFNLVLNAITASEFRRAYPEDGYVGKFFAIKKLDVVAGKRYKDVQIVEIAPVPIGNVASDDVKAERTVR